MPVYNGEKYVKEAIDSILNQTLTDFIFLIIDDGSTDDSANSIRSYNNSRIVFLMNEKNLGISKTLNRGIEHTDTKYIAIMHCDDISLPDRLEEQVRFMEAHPEVGLCGTWMNAFIATGQSYLKKRPVKNADIKAALLFRSPIAHPTVMMRKDILDTYHLRYDTSYDGLEDYDLWERMSSVTTLENIPKALLRYRLHPNQLGRTAPEKQEKFERIQKRQYERLGVARGDFSALLAANRRLHFYTEWSLRKIIYSIYYENFKSVIKKLIRW